MRHTYSKNDTTKKKCKFCDINKIKPLKYTDDVNECKFEYL